MMDTRGEGGTAYIGKGGDTPTEGTAASRRREQSVGVVEGVKVFQATNRRDP